MLADMRMDTGKHACRCLRHDNGGVRHLPVFKTKFLYRYFLALHLIESCYILLPCHVCADWSPNGPGTPADKPPVSHSRTEIAETPRPGAKIFVVSFRFVYIAHLCTFAFCDLWPNLSCRYVLSFLVRSHRGLSLRGDSHVALPCDEDISHLFVSEAGEPECYADIPSKLI